MPVVKKSQQINFFIFIIHLIKKRVVLVYYSSSEKNVWTSYDQEADILYMHFKKPNRADYSEMTEDEMIIRYEKDEIIGVTVLNASKR